MKYKNIIGEIIQNNPPKPDLTNEAHSRQVFDSVDHLLDAGIGFEDIAFLEAELIPQNKDGRYIFALLVLKLAKSKLISRDFDKSLLVSVVFAVYKEHHRILKQTQHPNGEDFLRRKVQQIQWLFADKPKIKWELVVVDDGCPEGSGRIAQRIIEEEGLEKHARVLFLEDAIRMQLPPAEGLKSTADSMKGGSIIYGMWDAALKHPEPGHIVVYTDADLSTHLGQLMLLIEPLQHERILSAIASRREPDSVVVKQGSRNDRGKLFIYLWKRLIPVLGNIIDTQCGFKAFKGEIVPDIIDQMIERKFAFDIELLLRTELKQKGSVYKVPVAWIDSEAESTTTDLQPYLPMLKAIVKMHHSYLASESRNEFADFIEQLSEDDFNRLLENIPEAITRRDVQEFTDWAGVSADDLRRAIG